MFEVLATLTMKINISLNATTCPKQTITSFITWFFSPRQSNIIKLNWIRTTCNDKFPSLGDKSSGCIKESYCLTLCMPTVFARN